MLLPEHRAADLAFVGAGARRLAADAAWVQLLLYAGGQGLPREGSPYEELMPRTLRVVRLDPHFTRAYVYGAGILAWFKGVERPREALALLEEGIRANPDYGPLKAYAAAILYKTQDRPERMIATLEEAAGHPDCPLVVKAILANLHKSRGDYGRAARIWALVLADPGAASEHARAREQIRRLQALTNKGR